MNLTKANKFGRTTSSFRKTGKVKFRDDNKDK